jgi:hypothetical protein
VINELNEKMHRRGLEPLTTRFEAGYSIRLSYRCLVFPPLTRSLKYSKIFSKEARKNREYRN